MSSKFIVFVENRSLRGKPRNRRPLRGLMEDLAQEKFCPVVTWICKKIMRGVFFNELTEIHEDDPVGDTFCESHLM